MQKERTLKFWDDFHETQGAKEWIVHPTSDLFEMIYSQLACPFMGGKNGHLLLRVLEIGCGTSTLGRDFWKYIDGTKKEECHLQYRSTDVSQVCVDACFARDKDMIPNVVSGNQGEAVGSCSFLEYGTLNVLATPAEADRGAWNAILDKACMDTFLFRSRHRGEHKEYPAVVHTALDNIWTMMADDGVYMLMSPRTKLKAVRDYVGFSSVERRAIHTEGEGEVMEGKKTRKKNDEAACYMYICRKRLDYVVGETTAFRENFRSLPMDDETCPRCGLLFRVFRNGESADSGRGVLYWNREWKNHCIHCKTPHSSTLVP